MKHINPTEVKNFLESQGPGLKHLPEECELINTKEVAYDGFHQELHIGDIVVFAASRWTGDYILYKGIVRGWSDKMVKIEAIDGATNSDKPAGMEYKPLVGGKISSRKPDKIYKL